MRGEQGAPATRGRRYRRPVALVATSRDAVVVLRWPCLPRDTSLTYGSAIGREREPDQKCRNGDEGGAFSGIGFDGAALRQGHRGDIVVDGNVCDERLCERLDIYFAAVVGATGLGPLAA
jgi:hypothetical protein